MPQVTVAIPAYRPQFLGQAIASVLAQTFDDYELLISDDAPDGTVKAVVARFADPRIRVIEGPRQGLVPNSMRLWEDARADLLKFVYDDDFLLPFALADLQAALAAQPDANYAFCQRHWVDTSGRITSSPKPLQRDSVTLIQGADVARALVGTMSNPLGEPTCLLIRRSRFDGPDCLGSFAGLPIRHMVDVAFFLNAAARGPCLGLPSFGAAFRRHPDQATSDQAAPAFSLAILEWEIFLRGAVSGGLVPAASALAILPRLEDAYRRFAPQFPELEGFLAGLPTLRTALEDEAADLVTDGFRDLVSDAHAAIAARRSI